MGTARLAKVLRRRRRMEKRAARRADNCPNTIAELEHQLDLIVADFHTATPPDVLYHYTKLQSARGILTSKEFWATIHRDMDDPAELDSAGDVIRAVATELRQCTPKEDDARVLDMLLDKYSEWKASEAFDSFLACFCSARDKVSQWRDYGDSGRGVCLGVKVIRDEPAPAELPPIGGRVLLQVDYDPGSWRNRVKRKFMEVMSLRRRCLTTYPHVDSGDSLVIAGVALQQIAAYAESFAKKPKFSKEEEWRIVGLAPAGAQCRSHQDGRAFAPLRVRVDGRLIALAEVIVGPDAPPSTEGEVHRLLAEVGYPSLHAPMPAVIRSTHSPTTRP